MSPPAAGELRNLDASVGPAAINWQSIRLVVFDVDGTLYSQRPLRLRMARALIGHCLSARDLRPLLVVRAYRTERETLADQECEGFEAKLIGLVADRFGLTHADTRAIVSEWIERRPLPMLRSARRPGVSDFFDAIRRSGKKIGILSDYPAVDKLQALGLDADYIVSAADSEVAVLKPHPRGLQRIMAMAGADASETIFIGDRADRDGEAGRRAGVRTLLHSRRALPGWECFNDYADFLRGQGPSLAI